MGKQNERTDNLEKLLYVAVRNKDISQTVRLIREGADVNAKGKTGNSILSYAVDNGDLKMVKMLIDRGADINIKNADNWTVLHFAADKKNLEMVSLLIQNGAEIDAEDNYGNTPFIRAVVGFTDNDKNRNKIVIECLIKNGADRFHKNKSGISAANLAIEDPVRKEITHLFNRY